LAERFALLNAGLRDGLRAAMAAGLVIGLGLGATLGAAPHAAAQAAAPASFADLAERLSPAVVNISTRQTVGEPDGAAPEIPPGAPFGDMFRDFFERNQRGPRTANSLGSGFVIDASGLIVTNNHVIEDADEITINFTDGSSLEAELLGRDPKTDLALLKVEPDEPLTAVSFGDSEAMRVGDWVLAIGNPFGLGGSVSAGIISARDRDINAGPYDDFIQTDAAINRGNSGGPLFNLDGEVIGVNTAIISPSGGSIGIGFSVPSELASKVIDQLREYGQTRRGWIGVRIQTVTPEIAESLGMEDAMGALIADVTEGGPAEEAGVENGDVIIRFDDRPVDTMRDLPRMVAETPVEETVRMTVWRDGESRTLKITLGLLEEGEVRLASVDAPAIPEGAGPKTVLGMSLAPLSGPAREEWGIDPEVKGVVVTAVEAGGAAAEKGISPGDIIVEAGQETVMSPADIVERIEAQKADGRKSLLLLVGDKTGDRGAMRFVALSIED
jgi:serine protease Do